MVLFGMTAWTAVALGVMTRPAGFGPFRSFEQEGRMPQIMAMAEAMRTFPNVARSGSVSSVTGDAPAALGAECSVTVKPARLWRSINCKVEIRCGAEIIYGEAEAGYARCEVRDGALVSASDAGSTGADGDAVLALDLDGRRVVVSDAGLRTYEVVIDLAEPGRATEL